jgi:hypothetical protein
MRFFLSRPAGEMAVRRGAAWRNVLATPGQITSDATQSRGMHLATLECHGQFPSNATEFNKLQHSTQELAGQSTPQDATAAAESSDLQHSKTIPRQTDAAGRSQCSRIPQSATLEPTAVPPSYGPTVPLSPPSRSPLMIPTHSPLAAASRPTGT